MEGKRNLQNKLELIWWVFTILFTLGVLYPIYTTKVEYPFWIANTLFIVVFITISRYIFLLKHTFLAHRQWLKAIVAVLCIPLFLYLMKELNIFRSIANEIGLEEMFDHLSLKGQTDMSNYVRSEMLFFGAGSLIALALMPIRLLISFWRTHNRGTV